MASQKRKEIQDARTWRRKLAKNWQEHKWTFLGAVWLTALALGWIGFRKYFLAIGEPVSFLDLLYRSLQLFILDAGDISSPLNWELETARWLAPAVAAFTAIEALALFFYDEFQILRLRFLKEHIVICGLGQKGFLLAKELRRSGNQVVVVERDKNNDLVKQCQEHQIITLIGDATDPDVLTLGRTQTAKYLIAVCGSDATNTLIAIRSSRLIEKRSNGTVNPLTCFIHLFNLQLGDLLKELQIKRGGDESFRLEYFNVFSTGANVLLNEYPPFDESMVKEETLPHLLVLGLGLMGESLVYQIAWRWKPMFAETGKKVPVLALDRAAEERIESLCLRYPMIEQVSQVIPLQMEVGSPDFERADFLFDSAGRMRVKNCYICMDDDAVALSAALALLRKAKGEKMQVVVRLSHNQGLDVLFQKEEMSECGFENLRVFSLVEKTCQPDLILGGMIETMARAIHENYISKHREQGITREDNPALVPWDELPEHLKESNRNQAQHIGVKLRAIGCEIIPLVDWDAEAFRFSPDEVEALARMEHERWMAERLAGGWRYADATKDIEKKTSPWLVPYEELPEEEKEKDRDAVRGIPMFLARIGFQIERVKQEAKDEPD